MDEVRCGAAGKGGSYLPLPLSSHAQGAVSREWERKRCLVLLSRQWKPEEVKGLALDALILVSQVWPRNFTDSDQSEVPIRGCREAEMPSPHGKRCKHVWWKAEVDK